VLEQHLQHEGLGVQQWWSSFGVERDETSTLARLRETRGGTEGAEETDHEIQNRPDPAETCGVARRPQAATTHSRARKATIHGDPQGIPIRH
jgi:hypothetical protein